MQLIMYRAVTKGQMEVSVDHHKVYKSCKHLGNSCNKFLDFVKRLAHESHDNTVVVGDLTDGQNMALERQYHTNVRGPVCRMRMAM